MQEESILNKIVKELVLAYKPLVDAAKSKPNGEGIVELAYQLGWDLKQHVALSDIVDFANEVINIFETIDSLTDDPNKLIDLMNEIGSFVDFVKNLGNLGSSNLDSPQVRETFAELGKKLIDYLIIRYLQHRFAIFHNFLILLGVINVTHVDASPPIVEHVSWTVNWNNLVDLFSSPHEVIKDAYGWGKPSFDAYSLFRNIRNLLWFINIPAGLQYDDPEGIADLDANHDQKDPILRIPILWMVEGDELFQIGGSLLPLRTQSGDNFEGIALVPFGEGKLAEDFAIGGNWKIKIEAKASRDIPYGVILHPEGGLTVGKLGVENSALPNIGLALKLFKKVDQGQKIILFGEEDATRLEAASIGIEGGFQIGQRDPSEFYFECFLQEAVLIIKPSEADGFLSKILPTEGFQSIFDLIIGWSSIEGLYFRGSASLEITIPIHKILGPIKFESIYLKLSVGDDSNLDIDIAASIGAQIGPVSATIDRIGLAIIAKLSQDMRFDLNFLPPTGAGLAIDAGAVVGGGYLEFDRENERYAGILQLAFGEIGLTAIGLITTRMPDGSKDFSMLVIIGVEFDPPISLPYNFNLSGVGGLLGIKRSMNVDYLREGLKQGTLDSVLFPQDPILNAPRIISDLRAGFPPTKDRYILGPMAIIGWGNPLIIRAEIGIFIEIPSPVRIAILGQITAQLPNAEEDTETIVVIHLDILGVLDFEKQSFSLDATIYDSRILQFALNGDMAMRLYWGDPPFFLTSFGGFNPKFKVRPGTPVLRRMMLSIGKGDNPRLSLECYMALTSNTTQFGAKLELTARKAGFKVHGYLYFHALFIFSPFSFVIDMGAGVEVYKGSRCLLCISLDFTLSGPTPWRAKGTGKFKIYLLKVKVRFDKSWGKRQSPSLPATDPWDLLKEALDNSGNWKGLLPGEKEQVIRLKKIEDAEGTVAVHPKGRLEISQNVLPFNLILQKFGNGPISGDDVYRITELQINNESGDIGKLGYVKDYFAKAQFIKMSDAEKLSRPSFEKEDANILIGSDDISMGSAVKYDLEYETEVIDENKVTHSLELTPVLWQFGGVLLHGRAKRESSPAAKKFRRSGLEPLVGLADERYRVVTKDSLNSVTEVVASYSQAQYMMQGFLESHPEQDGNIQIISE